MMLSYPISKIVNHIIILFPEETENYKKEYFPRYVYVWEKKGENLRTNFENKRFKVNFLFNGSMSFQLLRPLKKA